MSVDIKISNRPISYKYAINFLERRVKGIKDKKKNDLFWILEHPTTYTAGARYQKKEILDKSINVVKTNRGGKITMHNPGQKVIYFAINLNQKEKNIRKLISDIEKSIISFLKLYQIDSYADKKNIGIWVKGKKIAAIGIRISKWIAYHGCSININNDLSEYKKIVPCGLSNKKVTSLKDQNKINLRNINKNIKKIFLKNLFKN